MKKQLITLLFTGVFCLPFFATALAQDDKLTSAADITEMGGAPLPLVLTLFIHDQLTPREIAGLSSDYLEWFIKELRQVSRREVRVISVRNKPGYTDFNYRQINARDSIDQWYERVINYINENNLPTTSKRRKYVLLTQHKVSSDTKGIAHSGGVAIASLKTYVAPGHEIGHLLGATHENAETLYSSGIPCRTLMHPTQTEFFASCYRFSDKNREAIANYLDKI